MTRLALPQVTLVAIDTRAPGLAMQALQRSMASVDFGRAVLFTHPTAIAPRAAGIEIVDCGPIDSGAAYSHFVLRHLPAHVQTSHVLVTQWDGFVVDAGAWTDEFLACDYIGAVWPDQAAAICVGNGGFSLRSRRLLDAGLDTQIVNEHPEDQVLCRDNRALLEQVHGVRFAAPSLARRFAFENEAPRRPTFGFHGPKNLPHVLDRQTLQRWLPQLPDDFYRSRDSRRLMRSLLGARMGAMAAQVAQRRSAVGRHDLHTRVVCAITSILQRGGASR